MQMARHSVSPPPKRCTCEGPDSTAGEAVEARAREVRVLSREFFSRGAHFVIARTYSNGSSTSRRPLAVAPWRGQGEIQDTYETVRERLVEQVSALGRPHRAEHTSGTPTHAVASSSGRISLAGGGIVAVSSWARLRQLVNAAAAGDLGCARRRGRRAVSDVRR